MSRHKTVPQAISVCKRKVYKADVNYKNSKAAGRGGGGEGGRNLEEELLTFNSPAIYNAFWNPRFSVAAFGEVKLSPPSLKSKRECLAIVCVAVNGMI